MSFPRYECYKDSGVEWLGEVPEGWEVCSFRHSLSELFNGLTSNQVDETESTVPVTRIETISSGIIDEKRLGFIEIKDAREDRKLKIGDILFSNINSLNMIGNCAIYEGGRDIYAGMNLLVFRPINSVAPKWLYWLIRSTLYRQVVESLAKPAINQASISQTSINAIGVIVPPLPEQHTIAAFLDRETGKIDELVAEQERLIALLKEKRQATISHVVTKGLNPAAPMKDSGIEWLGEVPVGWEVKRLGIISDLIQTGPFGSQLHSGDYIDGETPVINPSNIQDGQIIPDWSCTVGQDIVDRLCQHMLIPGDIVFGRRGEMGRCAMASITEKGWLCGTGSLNVRLNKDVFPNFVSIYLRTEYVRELLKLESVGSTMDNLNTEILSRVPVPIPSPEEQSAIVTFLDTETAKIDTLVDEARQAISLLKERRSALISAAVTGKIDVRNLEANV